jgi:hypothetical protein
MIGSSAEAPRIEQGGEAAGHVDRGERDRPALVAAHAHDAQAGLPPQGAGRLARGRDFPPFEVHRGRGLLEGEQVLQKAGDVGLRCGVGKIGPLGRERAASPHPADQAFGLELVEGTPHRDPAHAELAHKGRLGGERLLRVKPVFGEALAQVEIELMIEGCNPRRPGRGGPRWRLRG